MVDKTYLVFDFFVIYFQLFQTKNYKTECKLREINILLIRFNYN